MLWRAAERGNREKGLVCAVRKLDEGTGAVDVMPWWLGFVEADPADAEANQVREARETGRKSGIAHRAKCR